MSIKAMKQALEKATEVMEAACIRVDELKAENESLRQAIAEAEKQEQGEPVGFYDAENEDLRREIPMGEDGDWWQPVYTHPQPKREWVGLTEDERQDIIGRTPPRAYLHPNDWTSDMLVYIEAKLKEKNT